MGPFDPIERQQDDEQDHDACVCDTPLFQNEIMADEDLPEAFGGIEE